MIVLCLSIKPGHRHFANSVKTKSSPKILQHKLYRLFNLTLKNIFESNKNCFIKFRAFTLGNRVENKP